MQSIEINPHLNGHAAPTFSARLQLSALASRLNAQRWPDYTDEELAPRTAITADPNSFEVEHADFLERWGMPMPIAEVCAEEAPQIEWLFPDYIARGCITLLSAFAKAGKTTLLLNLFRQMEHGGPLVGDPIEGKVLLVSEEPRMLWPQRREELDGLSNTILYSSPRLLGGPHADWVEYAHGIADLVQRDGIILCVFDTFAQLIPVDSENDSASMAKALEPFRTIANAGPAVVISHHSPKHTEGKGSSSWARGSTAFSGFADILTHLEQVTGHPSKRKLKCEGRLGMPKDFVIERVDGTYRAADPAKALAITSTKANAIIAALKDGPLSQAEITKATGITKSTVCRHLTDALKVGQVVRTGRTRHSYSLNGKGGVG